MTRRIVGYGAKTKAASALRPITYWASISLDRYIVGVTHSLEVESGEDGESFRAAELVKVDLD